MNVNFTVIIQYVLRVMQIYIITAWFWTQKLLEDVKTLKAYVIRMMRCDMYILSFTVFVFFVLFLQFTKMKTGFNSYTGNTTGVVGSGEVYKDPREKWTKGWVALANTFVTSTWRKNPRNSGSASLSQITGFVTLSWKYPSWNISNEGFVFCFFLNFVNFYTMCTHI